MCSLRGHLYLETCKYIYTDNNVYVLEELSRCRCHRLFLPKPKWATWHTAGIGMRGAVPGAMVKEELGDTQNCVVKRHSGWGVQA